MIGLCPIPWLTDEWGDSYWGLPPVGRWIIDFRSLADCGKRGEYGDHPHVLMCCDETPKLDGWEPLSDGDMRDARVDQKMLDTWEGLTGVAAQGDTLADLIWWHLTENADPKGSDRCKPLMASRDRMELHCHGLIASKPFNLGQQHANKVLAVIQDDFRATFDLAQQGKAPADLHLKLLDDLCDKHGVGKDRASWQRFVPADLRNDIAGPKPRTTAYSDNFNRANADPLGSSSEGWSWTEVSGDIDIASNMAVAANTSRARAEADLSSADHECQVTFQFNDGGSVAAGPMVRYASAADTAYFGRGRDTANQSILAKYVTGTLTDLDTVSTTIDFPVVLKTYISVSALKFYVGGVERNSITDTAISGGTRCGLGTIGTDTSSENWSCTDLAAATTRGMPFGTRGTAFNGGRTMKGILA